MLVLISCLTLKFLSLIGLSHEQNLRKMRFLSFVQLAEDKKEIEYAVIQREMQLEEADIEDFIIDGKRRLIFRHFVQCFKFLSVTRLHLCPLNPSIN